MRTLALIENDGAFATELRKSIEAEGFRTEWFIDGTSAVSSLAKRAYALAVVDLAIMDTDPFEVCRRLSSFHPVIALTTDPSDETCVRALEAGADDCLRKPFPARELVARIRNLLTRAETPDGVVSFDTFTVFVDAMRVRVNGQTHNLTRGESEVLSLLLDRSPAPLTIDAIVSMLPADKRVKRGTVESRIKSLRRKLGGRLVSRGRLGYQLGVKPS